MKLSEYKKGDRVKWNLFDGYEGFVGEIHQLLTEEPLLTIILDKPAPMKFNMGGSDVMAIKSECIELIKE